MNLLLFVKGCPITTLQLYYTKNWDKCQVFWTRNLIYFSNYFFPCLEAMRPLFQIEIHKGRGCVRPIAISVCDTPGPVAENHAPSVLQERTRPFGPRALRST